MDYLLTITVAYLIIEIIYQKARTWHGNQIASAVRSNDWATKVNGNETFGIWLRPFLADARIGFYELQRLFGRQRGPVSDKDPVTSNPLTGMLMKVDIFDVLQNFVNFKLLYLASSQSGDLPSGGSVRTEGDWQNEIKNALTGAKIIFIIPYTGDSIMWELKYLVDANLLGKAVFVIPRFRAGNNKLMALWSTNNAAHQLGVVIENAVDTALEELHFEVSPRYMGPVMVWYDRDGKMDKVISFYNSNGQIAKFMPKPDYHPYLDDSYKMYTRARSRNRLHIR